MRYTWKIGFSRMLNAGILAACLLQPMVLQANPKSYRAGRFPFQLDIPNDWQAAPGLYGMPVIFLGPEQKLGRRPAITVVPTGLKNFHYFDPKLMKADQNGFRTGREKWLQKVHGHSLEYFPYQLTKWPSVSEVHSIGYKYRIGDLAQVEQSYYLVCNGKLFFIKTLMLEQHQTAYAPVMDRILKSFSCEN